MTVVGAIVWVIFGAFVGGIAQFFVPGKQNLGWILSIALGIAGSFFGGWLFRAVGLAGGEGFAPSGLIGSTVGAVILLFVYVTVMNRNKPPAA